MNATRKQQTPQPATTARQSGRLPRLTAVILALVVSLASNLRAEQSATLAWDANAEPGVGYRLLCGESSRSYSHSIDVGTNTLGTIPNLKEGRTYYFAVKAYNALGLESEPSDEVQYTVPMPALRVLVRRAPQSVGFFRLSFSQLAGFRYQIQASEDLVTWTTLWETEAKFDGEELDFIDTERTASGRRFYRVVVIDR